jgi:vancomycin resistance protein YoaR
VPLAVVVLVLSGLSVVAARAWPGVQSDVLRQPLAEATAMVAVPVAAALTPTAAAAPTVDPFITVAALEVTFGEARRTLERDQVERLVAADRRHLDRAALEALTEDLADEWNQSVLNARFAFNGGNLTPIRESRQGRVLDEAGAADAIEKAVIAGQHSVVLPGQIVEPQVSSANPQALGITENLERGGTSFAGSVPEKAHNIRLAAERLNGVVVPPGGTFSFNQEVGPTTLDAGYKWGFGIEAGQTGARTVPSVAGGICQVATTLFQRVFWTGFPLIERHWHLYWIPAYTSRGIAGLDATVDADSGLDFRWSNPTDGYVLIQSATDDSNVYFGLYGKPRGWKVSVGSPQVSNRVAPNTDPVAQAEPLLPWGRIQPVETAREGFDISITRTVTREDGQPRPLTVQSSYEPSRTVTLVGTRDKPADADVDAVLRRVAPPRTPTPTITPTASAIPSPAASPNAVVNVSPVATVGQPAQVIQPAGTPTAAPTAVPSPTPAPPAATSTPAAAPAARTPSPAAATPTPNRR